MIGLAKPCRILHETTPFLRLGTRKACLLAAKSYLHATETISDAVVPLVDFRGWHRGFFHWFLDFLPRVLVAEHHHQRTGAQVHLLVPERLTAWQSESLARLSSPVGSLIPYKPRAGGTNIRCRSLIAASAHRHQHATEAPFDAISPIHLKQLAKRLGSASNGGATMGLPRRVFVSRRGAKSRRIINEPDVSSYLEGHGFCTIQLEKLSLSEQIHLFRQATHIIAVHGAGLTNLMHATQSTVLELFASAHGIRPDYFQIASILNLGYFFHCLPSLNSFHDIHLPLELVDDFLSIAPS
ncbi:MAG: glycosyltransferase family 61 protein [Aphanothece saxicola GSE-SYN-MK-01-06B]|nr:glycosyltransferase family 61 protein [Aphanothece saxicola GSE-SYN-MK-01-06B]